MVVVTKPLLQQCKPWYLLSHNVVTTTIEYMTIETVTFDTPVAFHTVLAFVTPLVALLT
jgi:hypothetical protein